MKTEKEIRKKIAELEVEITKHQRYHHMWLHYEGRIKALKWVIGDLNEF